MSPITFAVENAGLSPAIAPWANLAGVVIIAMLFVWLLVKREPEKERRLEERSDAKDALFLEAMHTERERSREAASSGHRAATALSDSIREMAAEIRRFNDHHNNSVVHM